MNMEKIRIECQEALALVENAEQLAAFWAKYLGKGGQVQKLMEGIKNVPNEEKKAYGQAVNQIKNWAQALYDEKKEEMDKKALLARYDEDAIDVTLPAEHTQAGNLHPLTCIKNEIIDVFAGMGFEIFEGPEIEDDDHNFTRLNVLKDHPSRDMQDTFWLTEDLLLRTHTSPGQIRVMDKQAPPI
jgi:phenylalanyl-tRNA synthetase alpha chain